MEIKLEGKTLVVGILLGAALTITLGIDNARDRATGRLVDTGSLSAIADKTDYALSLGTEGALVRVQNGDFFVVSPKSCMAIRVLHARRSNDDATSHRDNKGKQFNYTAAGPAEESDSGYGK